tara:strand:+ start:598 stop:783 length:186 start_codon:yes stop_codon:yes gene_type:complete
MFHPHKYDTEKVELLARLKLYAQFHDPRTIQILDHRPFGEEAIVYTIQHLSQTAAYFKPRS